MRETAKKTRERLAGNDYFKGTGIHVTNGGTLIEWEAGGGESETQSESFGYGLGDMKVQASVQFERDRAHAQTVVTIRLPRYLDIAEAEQVHTTLGRLIKRARDTEKEGMKSWVW